MKLDLGMEMEMEMEMGMEWNIEPLMLSDTTDVWQV